MWDMFTKMSTVCVPFALRLASRPPLHSHNSGGLLVRACMNLTTGSKSWGVSQESEGRERAKAFCERCLRPGVSENSYLGTAGGTRSGSPAKEMED